MTQQLKEAPHSTGNGPTGEDLKSQMGPVDYSRAQDALLGVRRSPLYDQFSDDATVGPYTHDELHSPEVSALLSDTSRVLIVTPEFALEMHH